MNEIKPLLTGAVLLALLAAGCSNSSEKDFLSSAVIESDSYQVAPSIQGQILSVMHEEGSRVDSGSVIAVIDTVPLYLKQQELASALAELKQQIGVKQAEASGLKAETEGVERELRRIAGLAEKGSATQQQLDQMQTQAESMRMRLRAAQLAIAALSDRLETMRIQLLQIQDQFRRCFVVAPSSGVILTKYRNPGEIAGPGAPLYEIGQTDTMRVDFYVPQPVVASLPVGGTVYIRVDDQNNKEERYQAAWISWISPEAEFSPKNIQTREARNELVFKVRALAPNKAGILKRGLPVEVWRRMPVK